MNIVSKYLTERGIFSTSFVSRIKTIQAKMKNVITAVENQTKKSLEILKAKRSAIQQQINAAESSLKEADKLLKRSTTAEVFHLKKSLHNEHCIKVFNRDGHFQYKFGKQGKGDGEFNYPCFLSVTQSKHLLVCDGNNNRIQVFEIDGKFVGKFGTKGSKLEEFNYTFSTAVLGNDQIVVCHENSCPIQIFQ